MVHEKLNKVWRLVGRGWLWGRIEIYNGILLSHKKEWNCAVCKDVNGPQDCNTKWSKSEREKQIYINVYM